MAQVYISILQTWLGYIEKSTDAPLCIIVLVWTLYIHDTNHSSRTLRTLRTKELRIGDYYTMLKDSFLGLSLLLQVCTKC